MKSFRQRQILLELNVRRAAWTTARFFQGYRLGFPRPRQTTEDFEVATAEIDQTEMHSELAAAVAEALFQRLPNLGRTLRRDRRMLKLTLESVWGRAFDEYDGLAYMSYEIGATLASADLEATRPLVWSTLLDLHARACCVAAEVGELQRSGYPFGADARSRTLHELAVVARVLQKSEETITARYRDYELVEQYQDAKEFQVYANALGQIPLPDEDMEDLRRQHQDVVAKWGPAIERAGGWAAPLFENGRRPGIAGLEKIAGIGHLRPFYRYWNHAVHGGPRASTLQRTQIEGVPHRTPGATVLADLAETTDAAMISLLQVTEALLDERKSRCEPPDPEYDLTLETLIQFRDRCARSLVAAAEAARACGWFDHQED